MKSTRTRILALAGAAVLAPALLFAAVAAQHVQHQHQGMVQHIAKKLGLSDDQTQQVQGIFTNHQSELTGQMDRLKTAKSALFDAVHSDSFDESAVRAAAANVAQVEADLAVSHAKIASEVRAILTPDQQAKAKELLANAHSRAQSMGDRMHHHMMGGLDGGV